MIRKNDCDLFWGSQKFLAQAATDIEKKGWVYEAKGRGNKAAVVFVPSCFWLPFFDACFFLVSQFFEAVAKDSRFP